MRVPVVSTKLLSAGLTARGNGDVGGSLGMVGRVARRGFASSERRAETWGFIGLGRMGYPMAKNLRAKIPAGDTLLVHDRDEQVVAQFLKEIGIAAAGTGTSDKGMGIEIIRSAREVAERSTTTITALPGPAHVSDVYHAILSRPLPPPSSGPERLFIDCSTIDPATSRSIANAVHSPQQGRFVDAPMSGGVVGAAASTLTFMLGASSRSGGLIDRVTPILLLMGARVVHMGEQGSGLAAKLANNYLLAVSNIATAEAMHIGVKLGLDARKLGDLINSSSGRCWSSEVNNPVEGVSQGAPAEKGYEGGFGVGLMRKDLGLALEAARGVGVNTMLGLEAAGIYERVEAAEGGKDFSVVYKWLRGS